MVVREDYREVHPGRRTAVTIGNFDGVHLGHRALLARVVDSAFAPAVLTFEPHPRDILCPESAVPRLCTRADRLDLLASCGTELVLQQRFDLDFAAKSPEAFVREVLVGALQAAHVVVGYDFTFGARATGDFDALRTLGERFDFTVDSIPAVEVDGAVVSSTRVREAVRTGEIEAAGRLLGRPVSLTGEVVRGAQRGRLLGFPTANLRCDEGLLPATGVYSGWLDWGAGPRVAVVNIGVNPTFGAADAAKVEAHVVGGEALELYGERVRLYLRARIREERRFDGADALRAQIGRDRDAAATSLAEEPTPEWP